MHKRLSIHQVGFPGLTLRQFASTCEAMGAHQMGFVSPPLLGEGITAARAALTGLRVKPATIAHAFSPTCPLSERTGWASARDTLYRLIDSAADLGIPTIYMLTGGRGTLAWEDAADAFAEAVRPCIDRAKAAAIDIAIENASGLYADIHIAHSLADTIRLADIADVAICIELFFAWPEAGLADLLTRAMPRTRIVQISDYVLGDRSLPSRAVPGDGVIPLASILRSILDAGYPGPFDLELLGPRIEAEGAQAAYARAATNITGLLASIGE